MRISPIMKSISSYQNQMINMDEQAASNSCKKVIEKQLLIAFVRYTDFTK